MIVCDTKIILLMELTEEIKEKILGLIKNGANEEEMRRELQVHSSSINKWLKEMGIAEDDITKAQIAKHFPNGVSELKELVKTQSLSEIAKLCSVNRAFVRKWLALLNLKTLQQVSRSRSHGQNPTEEQVAILLAMPKGVSVMYVARYPEINVSRVIARRWMISLGIPIPPKGQQCINRDERERELMPLIIELHCKGFSCKAISQVYGNVSESTVRRWLIADGYNTRPRIIPTDWQSRRLHLMHGNGFSVEDIAVEIGVPSDRVLCWLRRHGEVKKLVNKKASKPRVRAEKRPRQELRIKERFATAKPLATEVKVVEEGLPDGHKSIVQVVKNRLMVESLPEFSSYKKKHLGTAGPSKKLSFDQIMSIS
jgi:transposase